VDVKRIAENEFRLRHANGEQVTLRLRGEGVNASIRDGWVAPEYGVRQRAKVIVAEYDGSLPAHIEHHFGQAEGR
jgi:hypothetical protein